LKDHNDRRLFNVVYGGDTTIQLSQSLYDLNLLTTDSILGTTVNNYRFLVTLESSIFSKFDDFRIETLTGRFKF
jgi:hypothetical protein